MAAHAAAWRGTGRRLALAAVLLALAGCGAGERRARLPTPKRPPPGPRSSRPEPRAAPVAPADGELAAFYAGVQGELTARTGCARTRPPPTPFSVDDLVRNFERIALMDEYVDVAGS